MSRGRPSPGRDALGVYLQRPWLPKRLSPSRGPLPEESQPLLKGPHPPGHAGLAFHGRRVRLCSITGCWLQTRRRTGLSRQPWTGPVRHVPRRATLSGTETPKGRFLPQDVALPHVKSSKQMRASVPLWIARQKQETKK